MHDVDASFRKKRDASRARRRGRRLRRVAAACAALAVAAVGAGIYVTADQWSIDWEDEELVAVETQSDMPTDVPVYVPAVVDLAGDPMTITIGRGADGAPKVRAVPKPPTLTDGAISPEVSVLVDTMLSTSERLMTTIPSSPEDFAFFQAQRTARAAPLPDPVPAPQAPAPAPAPDTEQPVDAAADPAADFSDPAAGWGETISDGEESLPEFRRTRIENNTMVAVVRPENQRSNAIEDFVDKVLTARPVEELAVEHGFSADDGKRAAEAVKARFGKDQIEAGFVVAMRGLKRPSGPPTLVQLSLYADAKYIGTIARADDGSFVEGVDPWVRDDLLHYSGAEAQAGLQRQYRLLDAIYSTAVRNNVPTAVIGEAIMYLSRGQDLNAFASPGDRLVLAYSATPRSTEGSGGRVLFVAVQTAEKNLDCFVYKPAGADDYACVSENDQVHSVTVTNGMVTPVNGVLTSTFGPRRHPILKEVRIHKGVDWAAPTGTPIYAAFDGEIAFAGDGKGYGNVVRIAHDGGRETRYAHMSRFGAGVAVGKPVKAGDVIGYVGTTGLSTGPHLHFELYRAGQAIDPLQAAVAAVAEISGTGDEAVERLVNRIIHVESGGSATAKNPLSSATGLGQFIDSTWIRMMNTYRPDLARSLSRADLLALRFDPTTSREMVRRLAQEGEAYLKARGHQITAGRLYLCHFLGMEGAHIALSASDSATVAEVMGGAVMKANPFLNGKSIADLKDWAERKMRGKGSSAGSSPAPAPPVVTTKNVAQTSPEFVAYKTAMTAFVAMMTGPGAPVGEPSSDTVVPGGPATLPEAPAPETPPSPDGAPAGDSTGLSEDLDAPAEE